MIPGASKLKNAEPMRKNAEVRVENPSAEKSTRISTQNPHWSHVETHVDNVDAMRTCG
jgi:hypothetical protein